MDNTTAARIYPKGFTMDDERLKGNENCYIRKLLQRIKDIHSSKRNLDFAKLQAIEQHSMTML
jgi:hypothetical protein